MDKRKTFLKRAYKIPQVSLPLGNISKTAFKRVTVRALVLKDSVLIIVFKIKMHRQVK